MCEIPVFYATTEGQTRRIADRLAQMLKHRGFDSRAIDVSAPDAWCVDWFHVRGAILGPRSMQASIRRPRWCSLAPTLASCTGVPRSSLR